MFKDEMYDIKNEMRSPEKQFKYCFQFLILSANHYYKPKNIKNCFQFIVIYNLFDIGRKAFRLGRQSYFCQPRMEL